MRPSLALFFLIGFVGCAAEAGSIRTTRIVLPTPFGPVEVVHTHDNTQVRLTRTDRRETHNGHEYEVYTDSQGREWLRDTQPPHDIVPRGQLRANPLNGAGMFNPRGTSQRALIDFAASSYAQLCTTTGLDGWTGARHATERQRAAQALYFDNKTLQVHVRYSARQDVGFPHPDDFPRVRFDIQLQPGATASQGFASIALEGDVRDVAEFMMAQGVVRVEGWPVQYRGRSLSVGALFDAVGRRVVFEYAGTVIDTIALRKDGDR
jgi:hypothetical protein